MEQLKIPMGYHADLNLHDTQVAIKTVKDFFQQTLAQKLNLLRVSAPIFVDPSSGLNDNLNGVERPVSFDIKNMEGNAEIVHSLAKWKRYALKKYGFAEEDLVLIDKKDPAKHTAEIKAKMPKGFDIVVDATGAPSITEATFNFVHMGSKIVVYGVCPAEATIQVNPYKIFSQEYTIIGSFAQTHCFPRALAYLESGVVQVDELISHELPLEEYGTGLDLIVGKKAKKVIIHP